MLTTIYALIDCNNVIRYIGRTSTTLKQRLWGHIKEAKSLRHTHKNHWIRNCLSLGYRPDIVALFTVTGDGEQAEIKCIREYREKGYNLVNSTDGGDGRMIWPQDIRKKISEANKGKTPSLANRLAVSKANTGRKASPELRHKLSLIQTGHPVTAATRLKIGIGNKGRKPSVANQAARAAWRNRGHQKAA